MKTIPTASLLGAALIAQVAAQNPAPRQMRDAPTHEQLSLEYKKAAQTNPMRAMKPSTGKDPSVVNQPTDLISRSDFICFGGMATLVPKKAVLSIPKKFEDRMKYQPGTPIKPWGEFYAANRGWITTVEVSRAQAEGDKAIEEEVSERIGKSTNLVIATYMGGPISVLPLKKTEEEKAAEEAKGSNPKEKTDGAAETSKEDEKAADAAKPKKP